MGNAAGSGGMLGHKIPLPSLTSDHQLIARNAYTFHFNNHLDLKPQEYKTGRTEGESDVEFT